MDPDAGDITLNLLAEFLGAVEVAATGPPDSPCQSLVTVPAAALPQPCAARPEARSAADAEML